MMNTVEELPANLEGYQRTLYSKYCGKGYSSDSALYLTLLFGQTRVEQGPIGGLEFTITDPEVYIRTHPSALLVWNEFQSPGVLKDAERAVLPD